MDHGDSLGEHNVSNSQDLYLNSGEDANWKLPTLSVECTSNDYPDTLTADPMLTSPAPWMSFLPTSMDWNLESVVSCMPQPFEHSVLGTYMTNHVYNRYPISPSQGITPMRQRVLFVKHVSSAAASTSGNFILQSLRTYPRMMLRNETKPPFIHLKVC